MIRVTAKLATKLHFTPAKSKSPDSNPYADWTAHLFTADRTQYLLVSNTKSLYSMVLYGAGITSDDGFVDRVLHHMSEFLSEDGFELIFQRLVIASAAHVALCRPANRSVTGSMTELVHLAKGYLIDQGLSPFDTALRLNEAPMSYLDYASPRAAFAAMKLDPDTV